MSKVFIEETTLSAIGDAIRGKTGKTELIAPLSMATEISSITTGGGGDIEVEHIELTGDCPYGAAGAVAGAYIELFGDTISTKDITKAEYMFYRNSAKEIPFDINFKANTRVDMDNMFQYSNIEEVPAMTNVYPESANNLFNSCKYLRYVPDDFGDDWDWSRINSYIYSGIGGVFAYCQSLRKIPSNFYKHFVPTVVHSSYHPYGNNGFVQCYSLDELVDLPVDIGTRTSNVFSSVFNYLGRIKELTFITNEDGTPKVANWKGQTIMLTVSVGSIYPSNEHVILDYNSGITADKRVKDDATYQALKDDPDWYTTDEKYSRYNHDSVVNTINSLPDTSAYLATAGGTNTIKFSGAAGSATDGGAINTLTEEEIAVATEKGWTVTLV